MKKIAFAAVLAATTAFAMPAYAATTDATVISGNVPSTCSITGPDDNAGINLTNGAITDLGKVLATCNSAGGFHVTVHSDNSGVLKDTQHSTSTAYAYTLGASGVASGVNLANDFTYNGPAAVFTNQGVDVKLTMGARSGQDFAGHYQDVLRWSITAD